MTRQQAKEITFPILERMRRRGPKAGHCPSIAGNWGPVFDTLEEARAWLHAEWNRLYAEEKLDTFHHPMIHTRWFKDSTGGKAP